MPIIITPGVLWNTPGACALDGNVVDTLANADKALLTPVRAPRVPDVPELLTVFSLSPANNADFMDSVDITSVVTVDATSVVIKRLRDSNRASDGSTLVNFLHHLLLAADWAKLIDLEVAILVRDETSFTWVAVAADIHCTAADSIVVAACTID